MTGQWDREAGGVRLAQSFDALSLDPQPDVSRQLLDLCELLASWATRISLTGHRQPGAILDRLVLDALALSAALPAAPSIADLGSGAGFPGLPLALLAPDCQVTLVESRERKHHFQREAVRRLGLANARPLLGRSDRLEPEAHGLVIAQAMAPPSEAVPQLLTWAQPGAWLVIPGGESPPVVPTLPGVEHAEIRRYQVPITGVRRTLWIGRRAATLL